MTSSDPKLNKIHDTGPLGRTLWRNGLANEYNIILQERIPSDLPAYLTVFKLLEFLSTGGRILDIGCLTGTNTELLRKSVNPSEVVGIDIIADNIARARQAHDADNISFEYVGEDEPIPGRLGKFHSAFAGFVIPTINNLDELSALFYKTFNALLPEGAFIMLQLNPASLKPGANYGFYHHTLNGVTYADGQSFQNTLVSLEGKSVTFDDYCWTPGTIKDLLENAGFINIEIRNLTTSMNGKMGQMLKASIAAIEDEFQVTWEDEWSDEQPLYQLIVAKRPAMIES